VVSRPVLHLAIVHGPAFSLALRGSGKRKPSCPFFFSCTNTAPEVEHVRRHFLLRQAFQHRVYWRVEDDYAGARGHEGGEEVGSVDRGEEGVDVVHQRIKHHKAIAVDGLGQLLGLLLVELTEQNAGGGAGLVRLRPPIDDSFGSPTTPDATNVSQGVNGTDDFRS